MSKLKKAELVQPNYFEFTKRNLLRAKEIIAKYPANNKRSAVMPLLYLAQEQHNNWIPRAAMDYIAALLEIAPMHVYEVAHFYTMYNTQPVGTYLVQICRTTPCWLRGADNVTKACQKKLGINIGETTPDGKFTLMEVECLGACVNAPVAQINNDYYEDIDESSVCVLLEELRNRQMPKPGTKSNKIG